MEVRYYGKLYLMTKWRGGLFLCFDVEKTYLPYLITTSSKTYCSCAAQDSETIYPSAKHLLIADHLLPGSKKLLCPVSNPTKSSPSVMNCNGTIPFPLLYNT